MSRCSAFFIAAAWATIPILAGSAQAPSRAAGPQRIVSLVPSATDLLIALGEQRRIVGRTDFDTDGRIAAIPSVGGTVDGNIEAIIALRPDLVLAWDERSAPHLLVSLRRASLNVEIIPTETLGDLRSTMRRLGTLLHVQERADTLLRAMNAGLDSIRAITATRPRVRTFFLVWARPLITTAGGTFIDSLITIAGGLNIFGDMKSHWPVVSIESVIARKPDVILWPRQMVDRRTDLADDAIWRGVHAVGQGRVFLIDPNLLARPGSRVVEAAGELARLIASITEATP